MDTKTIAKMGYEAYSRSTNNKNYQGYEMPKFDDLSVAIQNAWVAATEEILKNGKPFYSAENNQNIEEIQVGDQIRINTLVTTVLKIKNEFGEVFYSTEYGDFNRSICQKA